MRRIMPARPIVCMGKKVRLKKINMSQKFTMPSFSLIMRPNIFGNQKYTAPCNANRLPPNRARSGNAPR